MQKKIKYIGKFAQMLITIFLAILFACNLYFFIMARIIGTEYPAILGYSTAVVVSGSMEPALSVDDFIVNHMETNYKEGDIITFQKGDSLTTHRIVAVTDRGYVTQGDANNIADQDVVLPEEVVGRVVGIIPYIGRMLVFLKKPFGTILLVFTGFFIIEFPLFFQRQRGQMEGEEQ